MKAETKVIIAGLLTGAVLGVIAAHFYEKSKEKKTGADGSVHRGGFLSFLGLKAYSIGPEGGTPATPKPPDQPSSPSPGS